MAHRLALAAEAALDDIWYYIAKESESFEIAAVLLSPPCGRSIGASAPSRAPLTGADPVTGAAREN
jgi:hypothetical protein